MLVLTESREPRAPGRAVVGVLLNMTAFPSGWGTQDGLSSALYKSKVTLGQGQQHPRHAQVKWMREKCGGN